MSFFLMGLSIFVSLHMLLLVLVSQVLVHPYMPSIYVCWRYLMKLMNAIKFQMKIVTICFQHNLFLNLSKARLFSLLLAVLSLLTFLLKL